MKNINANWMSKMVINQWTAFRHKLANESGKPRASFCGNLKRLFLTFTLLLSAALPAKAVSINEYPIPTAAAFDSFHIANIVVGPDGNLWFTETQSNKIGRITTTGAFTEFPIPTPASGSVSITVGPDSNLWFFETNSNKIGRITTAGDITEFPGPTGLAGNNFAPNVIGPDGNIWFTEPNTNKIARFTMAGVLTEFPLPAGGIPVMINLGPDGNLWFIEFTGNKIGRITTSGVINEFSIPTPAAFGSGLVDLAIGADGNLWFNENNCNKIGRITTSGAINEFPIPTENSGTNVIVAGPDGNLWFFEADSNEVGRITTTGVITEFPFPTAGGLSSPFGAVGSDGNGWIPEMNANKIARITMDGAVTEFPVPTANSMPGWVAAGPDDNIWFIESNGNKIGQVVLNDTSHTSYVSGAFTSSPTPTMENVNVYVTTGDSITWNATGAILGQATTNNIKSTFILSGTYAGWDYFFDTYTIVSATGAIYKGSIYGIQHNNEQWGMTAGDVHGVFRSHDNGVNVRANLTSIKGVQAGGVIDFVSQNTVTGTATLYNNVPLIVFDGFTSSATATGYYNGAVSNAGTTLQFQLPMGWGGISFGAYETAAGSGNSYSCFDSSFANGAFVVNKGMVDGALFATFEAEFLGPAKVGLPIFGMLEHVANIDTTPDPFTFTDQTNVPVNSTVVSNAITVSGINTSTAISIAGGEYSVGICGGWPECRVPFTSAAGIVYPGEIVTIRLTSSSSYSTMKSATLTIGGVSATFNVTTVALDDTPDPFAFTARNNVAVNTIVVSNGITVSGINGPTAISIAGGEYSVGICGGWPECRVPFTSAAGIVYPGEIVTVRLTSSSSYSTMKSATLTIGGVSGVFNVTTMVNPAFISSLSGAFTNWPSSPIVEYVDIAVTQGESTSMIASGSITGPVTLSIIKKVVIQTGSYTGWGYQIADYSSAGYSGTLYVVFHYDQWWAESTGDIHAVAQGNMNVSTPATWYISSMNGVQTSGVFSVVTTGTTTGTTDNYHNIELDIMNGWHWLGTGSGFYNGVYDSDGTALSLPSLNYEGLTFGTYHAGAYYGNAYTYFSHANNAFVHKGMANGGLLGISDFVFQDPVGIGSPSSGQIEHVVPLPNFTTAMSGTVTSSSPVTSELVNASVATGAVITFTATGVISGQTVINEMRSLNIQTGSYAGWGYSTLSYALTASTGTVYSGMAYFVNHNGELWGMASGDIHAVVRSHDGGNHVTWYITRVKGIQAAGNIDFIYGQHTTPGSTTLYNNIQLNIITGQKASGTFSGYYNGALPDFGDGGITIQPVIGTGMSSLTFGAGTLPPGIGNSNLYAFYDDGFNAGGEMKGMMDGGLFATLYYTVQGATISGMLDHAIPPPSPDASSYFVIPSAGAGGSINPSTPQPVGYNTSMSFTVTPGAGYHIGVVSGCSGTLVGNTYTTGAVTSNCTVIATFTSSTSSITIASSPSGRQITVDGTAYTAPQTFTWDIGSNHTIGTTSPQSGGPGIQYVYSSWSDGGAQSHTITIPSVATTYTANFTTLHTTAKYTIAASPSGRQITVDGGSYTAPQTFTWDIGSNHTIGTSSPQSGGTGIQYAYASWSDGGAQSHSITLPVTAATYTANFSTQYQLTTAVSPTGSGSVSPDCSAGCWYNSGSVVSVTAVPAIGYKFSKWAGASTSTANPVSVTMTGPKSLTATFAAVIGMDLIETSVSNPPATVLPGGSFTVTDTVLSQGTTTAGASTTRYYLSTDRIKNTGDKLLTGSRSVPTLAPMISSSGTVTVTVPTTTVLGAYYLIACADDLKAVAESSETNNCVASATTVMLIANDLVETAVSEPPTTVLRGGQFSVTDTVRNQGNAAAGASTTRYYLSADTIKNTGDKLLTGTRPIPVLDAGLSSTGTVTVNVPTTTVLGTYYLIACADDLKAVAESNETNNCIASATTIQVIAPDLVETTVSNPTATAKIGSTFSVIDTVQNQGTATAGASTTRYYLSLDTVKDTTDKLLTGTRAVPSLAAGSSSTGTVTVTIPTTTVAGTYYLIVCADDLKKVTESNEANNCTASVGRIQVTP